MSAAPTLRPDLTIVEQTYRGEQRFIIKDPKHRTYFRFRLSLTFCYNQAAVTKITNVNAISTFTRYPWVFRGLVSGPTAGAVPSVFTVESYAQGQYEACVGSTGIACDA